MHASFWLALYRDCNRSQLSFCSEASHLRAAALMQRTEGLAQALEVCENGVALLREKSWPAVKLLLRYTELLQAAEKHERAIKACEEAVAEAESYDIQSQRAYYKLSVMYEGEGRNAEAKAMCFKGVARRGDDGDHDDAKLT
jgi:tetratricopeptide (TPR) repeat protein